MIIIVGDVTRAAEPPATQMSHINTPSNLSRKCSRRASCLVMEARQSSSTNDSKRPFHDSASTCVKMNFKQLFTSRCLLACRFIVLGS